MLSPKVKQIIDEFKLEVVEDSHGLNKKFDEYSYRTKIIYDSDKGPSVVREFLKIARYLKENLNHQGNTLYFTHYDKSFKLELNPEMTDSKMIFQTQEPPSFVPTPSPSSQPAPELDVIQEDGTLESKLLKMYNQAGYLDLEFMASEVGIDVDKIIRMLYRLMDDFDGDIDGSKFKPVNPITIEGLKKLIEKLK